jgi:3-hydroxybutyryl-CoA dehydrogenase
MSTVSVLGVLGAGQMGAGIAHVAAESGIPVVLVDISLAAAEKGKAKIVSFMGKAVEKGKMAAEHRDASVARIRPAGDLEAFSEADFVVEAATENIGLKLDLFRRLDEVVPPGATLATNTSSISITKIAAATRRPEQVIGMHFMNPVPVMKLVEIILGLRTDDSTRARTLDFAARLGKTTVVAKDMPGFAVNRILMPMINEAFYTLHEGIASAADIDAAMKLGTNQPMGPLTLADFIGLDTCLAIMEVLHEGLGDSKYRPCPALRKYVEAGLLGKKAGRGVYDYSEGK